MPIFNMLQLQHKFVLARMKHKEDNNKESCLTTRR